MNIEKLILNTWKKIPGGFKERFKDLKIHSIESKKDEPNRLVEFYDDTIMIYSDAMEKKFQREMDQILIAELARYFGFEEDEAYQIIKKT